MTDGHPQSNHHVPATPRSRLLASEPKYRHLDGLSPSAPSPSPRSKPGSSYSHDPHRSPDRPYSRPTIAPQDALQSDRRLLQPRKRKHSAQEGESPAPVASPRRFSTLHSSNISPPRSILVSDPITLDDSPTNAENGLLAAASSSSFRRATKSDPATGSASSAVEISDSKKKTRMRLSEILKETPALDELSGPSNKAALPSATHSKPSLASRLSNRSSLLASRKSTASKELQSGPSVIVQLPSRFRISYFRYQKQIWTDADGGSLVLAHSQSGGDRILTLMQNVDGKLKNVLQRGNTNMTVSVNMARVRKAVIGESNGVASAKIRLSLFGGPSLETCDIEFKDQENVDKLKRVVQGGGMANCEAVQVETVERLNAMFERAASEDDQSSKRSAGRASRKQDILGSDILEVSSSPVRLKRRQSPESSQSAKGSSSTKIRDRLVNSGVTKQSLTPAKPDRGLPDRSGKARAAIRSSGSSSSVRRSGRLALVPAVEYTVPDEELEQKKALAPLLPSIKPWTHSIVYPPTGSRKTTVCFTDLVRLNDGEFLNDNLIEFYLRYLQEQHILAAPTPASVFMFSTHFYTMLTTPRSKGIDYGAIARWTNKEDIFSKDLVVIPINESSHWYLAVVFNLKSIASMFESKTEPKEEDGKAKDEPDVKCEEPVVNPAENGEAGPTDDTGAGNDQPPPLAFFSPMIDAQSENDDLDSEAIARIPGLSEDEEMADLQYEVATSTDGRNSPNFTSSFQSGTTLPSPKAILEGAAEIRKREASEEITPRRSKRIQTNSRAGSAQPEQKAKPATEEGVEVEPFPPPYVVILDSFSSGKPSRRAVASIKDYLVAEAQAKRGWTLNRKMFHGINARQLPQQSTLYDCGVYLLYYIDALLRDWQFALEMFVSPPAPPPKPKKRGLLAPMPSRSGLRMGKSRLDDRISALSKGPYASSWASIAGFGTETRAGQSTYSRQKVKTVDLDPEPEDSKRDPSTSGTDREAAEQKPAATDGPSETKQDATLARSSVPITPSGPLSGMSDFVSAKVMTEAGLSVSSARLAEPKEVIKSVEATTDNNPDDDVVDLLSEGDDHDEQSEETTNGDPKAESIIFFPASQPDGRAIEMLAKEYNQQDDDENLFDRMGWKSQSTFRSPSVDSVLGIQPKRERRDEVVCATRGEDGQVVEQVRKLGSQSEWVDSTIGLTDRSESRPLQNKEPDIESTDDTQLDQRFEKDKCGSGSEIQRDFQHLQTTPLKNNPTILPDTQPTVEREEKSEISKPDPNGLGLPIPIPSTPTPIQSRQPSNSPRIQGPIWPWPQIKPVQYRRKVFDILVDLSNKYDQERRTCLAERMEKAQKKQKQDVLKDNKTSPVLGQMGGQSDGVVDVRAASLDVVDDQSGN